MTLATYLKTKREKANLSQGELGQLLGHKWGQFVSNNERSISMPAIESLNTLATALKVPLAELKDQFRTEYMARAEKTLAAKLEAVV